MMLTQLKTGELARIVAIDGGHGLRQKLYLRGIFKGCFVRMISCSGPVIIEVDGNIVCIGRGMAQKIRVRKV